MEYKAITLVSVLGIDATFKGSDRLSERPISPLKEEMEKKWENYRISGKEDWKNEKKMKNIFC